MPRATGSDHRIPHVPWSRLRNPILQHPDWSLKDACLAWRAGWFYLFASAFLPDGEFCRSHLTVFRSRDLRRWSPPLCCLSGREMGLNGLCSPDVIRVNEVFYLACNSWGYERTRPNQLFYMTSSDLLHWSPLRTLAPELTHGVQVIDAALAYEAGTWRLVYQQETDKKLRIASAPSLDGPWQWIGDGYPRLWMADGTESALRHENCQFVRLDGQWRLFSSDYSPRAPVLYTLNAASDRPLWLEWTAGRILHAPAEEWNSLDRDNAAWLTDQRAADGHVYMLYCGRNATRANDFVGPGSRGVPWARGWNRIGIARSRDLMTWNVPGQGRT